MSYQISVSRTAPYLNCYEDIMENEFDEWWREYCKVTSLNKEHLSFLDVTIFKEEMRLAFYRKLPQPHNPNSNMDTESGG